MYKALRNVTKHPRVLWLVPLAALLFVPLLFAAILGTIGLAALFDETLPVSAGAMLFLAGLFATVFVLAAAYVHALFLAAADHLSRKRVELLGVFREARSLYWRSLALNLFIGAPAGALVIVALFLFTPIAFAPLIIAGLWLVLAPFLFTRSASLLATHSLKDSLMLSVRDVSTKSHYWRWGLIKLGALVVTLVYAAFTYPQLVAQPLWVAVGLLAAYFFFTLASVLVPAFAVTNVLVFTISDAGALIGAHVFIVLPLQLLFILLVSTLLAHD